MLRCGTWNTFLTPLILGICLLAAVGLALAKLPRFTQRLTLVQKPAVTLAMMVLLLTPLIWSFVSDLKPSVSALPTAGPTLSSSKLMSTPGIPGIPSAASGMSAVQVDNKLLHYLEGNQGLDQVLAGNAKCNHGFPVYYSSWQTSYGDGRLYRN